VGKRTSTVDQEEKQNLLKGTQGGFWVHRGEKRRLLNITKTREGGKKKEGIGWGGEGHALSLRKGKTKIQGLGS